MKVGGLIEFTSNTDTVSYTHLGPWKRADCTFEGDIHQWLYRTYGSDPWRRHYPKPDLQCTVPAAGSSCDLSCDRLFSYLSGRKT